MSYWIGFVAGNEIVVAVVFGFVVDIPGTGLQDVVVSGKG